MAKPTSFTEQNTMFTARDGQTYPVWLRETTLGREETQEVISAWQLSPDELTAVNDSEGIVFLCVLGGQPPVEVLGGDPVPFEGQNRVYTHPDCRDLPVHVSPIEDSFVVTSAWQLNIEWRTEINRNGGVVFLRVIGGQPMVKILGICPIRS